MCGCCCRMEADHTAVHYASLYYIRDLLDAGVKVYLYTNGFIHSKVWLADGKWASVGTANLDNRSLLLNFEVNCLIYTDDATWPNWKSNSSGTWSNRFGWIRRCSPSGRWRASWRRISFGCFRRCCRRAGGTAPGVFDQKLGGCHRRLAI